MAESVIATALTALVTGLGIFAMYLIFKAIGKVLKRWADEEPK